MRQDEEGFADDFDCELYRLISAAEYRGKRDPHWRKIADGLHGFRYLVRQRMSEKDRKEKA